MKRKMVGTMVALLMVVSLVACEKVLRIYAPEIGIVTVEKVSLAKIVVYVGEVPLGESGRSASGTEINRGGEAVFTAQGRDANGNPVAVDPTWIPTKPGIVEITPAVGQRVTVKGLREGTVDIVVEYEGVKTTIEFVAVR